MQEEWLLEDTLCRLYTFYSDTCTRSGCWGTPSAGSTPSSSTATWGLVSWTWSPSLSTGMRGHRWVRGGQGRIHYSFIHLIGGGGGVRGRGSEWKGTGAYSIFIPIFSFSPLFPSISLFFALSFFYPFPFLSFIFSLFFLLSISFFYPFPFLSFILFFLLSFPLSFFYPFPFLSFILSLFFLLSFPFSFFFSPVKKTAMKETKTILTWPNPHSNKNIFCQWWLVVNWYWFRSMIFQSGDTEKDIPQTFLN